ncbi:MAG: enoyl-CoA hydratase-related protein [Actinomycetota bacterium]
MSEPTTYALDKGIATITLNHPDNRNALSTELLNSLGDNLEESMQSDHVRVIVLTNEGNTFCAGADLKGGGVNVPSRYSLVDIFQLMMDGPKPVVGKIAGHCMGGGVGLAAACDISIAADDAMFGFTEVRIGVAPAIISVVVLPKMRRADALELFLSGERIPASRAVHVGLINAAAPRESLDDTTDEFLTKIAAGGPLALAAAKELIYKVPSAARDEAFKWTAKLSSELFRSDEAAEGMKAFRERSMPPWSG